MGMCRVMAAMKAVPSKVSHRRFGIVVALAAVDDLAGFWKVGHFLQRKRVAQNVLGKVFKAVVIVFLNAIARVNAEATLGPPLHLLDLFRRQLLLCYKELQHAGTQQFGDLFPVGSVQRVKGVRADKRSVADEDVQVRVEVQVITESLDCDDDAGRSRRRAQAGADDVAQAQPGCLTEVG